MGMGMGSIKHQTLKITYHAQQSLELCIPENRLSPEEISNVCSLAFPDSNSAGIGSHVFPFRIRSHHNKLVLLIIVVDYGHG